MPEVTLCACAENDLARSYEARENSKAKVNIEYFYIPPNFGVKMR